MQIFKCVSLALSMILVFSGCGKSNSNNQVTASTSPSPTLATISTIAPVTTKTTTQTPKQTPNPSPNPSPNPTPSNAASEKITQMPTPKDTKNDDSLFDILKVESLDFLKINMLANEVQNKLGNPEEKSANIILGYDGNYHQNWDYKSKGISLGLVGVDGKQSIDKISIKNPSKYQTKKNIGIGSTKNQIQNAYGKEITKDAAKPDWLIVGTIYGGLMFELEDDKVSQIFIGAAAE